jgi:hypothetical protein
MTFEAKRRVLWSLVFAISTPGGTAPLDFSSPINPLVRPDGRRSVHRLGLLETRSARYS